MIWDKNNKTLAFIAAGLFVMSGTYNAVVINSESTISSSGAKFVKRLDEVYGVTVAGREVAAAVNWQKLSPEKISPKKVLQVDPTNIAKTEGPSTTTPEEIIPAAAIQEELKLTLVEVINPVKWKDGLLPEHFNGNISTRDGVIDDLNVSFPGGDGISVVFSEMSGNVFEYDYKGDLYSGMMYQVDQNSYMVTLTGGPLAGTRMRFASEPTQEEQELQQQVLADNNVEVGNFESPTEELVQAEQIINHDEILQQNSMQAQGFNLEQSSL